MPQNSARVARDASTDLAAIPQGGRLVVPDVLRGFAIVAMLIAHAAPFIPNVPSAVHFLNSNFSAVASPLFALVMGMSAELVWRRGGKIGTTLLHQCLRGLFLVVLGVWMATWGSWVAVVLAYLGVLIIVGAPLLLARTPVVIGITILLFAISEPLLELARTWTWVYTAPAPVRDLMEWTFLGPQYRVVNLLPMFLIGAVLVRRGFRRDRLLWVLAVAAPVAFMARGLLEYFDIVRAQSGDYVDTLRDFGLVFVVYVCVVLSATAQRAGAKRFWGSVFTPLIACGQVALSLYLLHVGLIAAWNTSHGRPTENLWLGWAAIVPVMILVGWVWWRFVGTGPVEWVMGWLTGRPRKRAEEGVAVESIGSPTG